MNLRFAALLGQCANSPGSRAYCYAEFAVSSLAVAVTIASTHFAYQRRDGQAELTWVVWSNTKMVYVYLTTVTHLRTNPARRRVTSLMCPMTLLLSQTTTNHIVTSVMCPEKLTHSVVTKKNPCRITQNSRNVLMIQWPNFSTKDWKKTLSYSAKMQTLTSEYRNIQLR